MNYQNIVLIKATTARGRIDDYSEDFDEIKLGESLALGYLKSFLDQCQKPWNVFVINPLIDNLSVESVASLVLSYNPFLVGVSLVYQWHRNFAFDISKLIKQESPDTHVVLGGLYTTSDWFGLLRIGEGVFDSICRGEGEETFLELADALVAKRNWKEINGLAYLDNGRPTFSKLRPRITDLSKLPFPNRNQLPQILGIGGVIQVEASRGCNAGCTFCDVRHTGWIGRPVYHLVDEIELLVNDYPGSELWFVDNIFIGFGENRFERAEQIAREILSRRIPLRFSFQDRADNIKEDLLCKLKEAGLNRIYIGIESFSDSALHRWQKRTSANTNKQALHILKKIGIFTQMGFLVFDDKTTLEEIKENINGLRETAYNNPYLHLHNFNELVPYAGTFLERTYVSTYGHAPTSINPWYFQDTRVRVFRDWVWKYLEHLWPVTKFIFHHFDNSLLQLDLPLILPTKNQCFIEYLEFLYKLVTEESSQKSLLDLCTSAVVNTKRHLEHSLSNWENPNTKVQLTQAVNSITENISLSI